MMLGHCDYTCSSNSIRQQRGKFGKYKYYHITVSSQKQEVWVISSFFIRRPSICGRNYSAENQSSLSSEEECCYNPQHKTDSLEVKKQIGGLYGSTGEEN